MKTLQKPATSKLVVRFDNQLRNLLMEDLKAFKANHNYLFGNNNQAINKAA